ncbi:hypothetical protein [Paraburkholderia bannensis]|uniref:hypothetical protein n=1 Tax=Paraburkholderia bannensis TaxID=765414 RepID=UPI002AB6CE0C|nr:hypothetical protein [Paraburkholderia bannensis]
MNNKIAACKKMHTAILATGSAKPIWALTIIANYDLAICEIGNESGNSFPSSTVVSDRRAPEIGTFVHKRPIPRQGLPERPGKSLAQNPRHWGIKTIIAEFSDKLLHHKKRG